MRKVAVYYIATNKYIEFFNGFIDGMKYFFPCVQKKVVLITDCNCTDFSKLGRDDMEIEQHHIDHHYWPIPTLFKMFYIEKFFRDDCDYHFYCNANLFFKNAFEFGKEYDLYVMRHYGSPDAQISELNKNERCIQPPEWSECYIDNNDIPYNAIYCQGGFFGGKREPMKSLLHGVNSMLREDLTRNVIPLWHDETYLNKYMLENYWKKNTIGDVKVISMPEYADWIDKHFNKFKL